MLSRHLAQGVERRAGRRGEPAGHHLGSFAGPPLVGALAELASLSAALGVLVAAAAAVAFLAPRSLPP